jgi:capsular exopolysaccharide synthesis family protein
MTETIDLRVLLGLMRRQLWLILSVAIAMIFLISVVVFSLTPRYTAQALVLVDTSSKNLLDPETGTTNGSTDNSRVESEVRIAQSDSVLLNVARDASLVSDDEFGLKIGLFDKVLALLHIKQPTLPSGEAAVGAVLDSFRKAVVVRREGLTYLLSASVTSKSPARAAQLANMLTAAYIRNQIDSKIAGTVDSKNIVQSQVGAATAVLIQNENKIDGFFADNLNRLASESQSPALAALKSQLDQVNRDRTLEFNRLSDANQKLQNGDLSAVVVALQSDALKELQRQKDALNSQLSGVTAGSKKAIDLQNELGKLDESLRQQATSEVSALQSSLATGDAKTDDVRKQIRNAILGNLPPETMAQIYVLQQSAQISRTQYQNLLTRLQDLTTQASLQLADSRVVSSALEPTRPSFPNKQLILTVAALAALGMGVGAAFLREYFVGGFTSEHQVAAVLNIPLASVAPQQQGGDELDRPHGHGLSDHVISSPFSIFSESIRRIRVVIDQALFRKREGNGGDAEGVIVMVSSTLPGEGKSTMAMSLARTYALAGKRTLLIDCDLRKPSVHRHLDMEPTPAFVNFLRDEDNTGLSSLVSTDGQTGLSVILGAKRPEFPTDDLLMGARIGRLLGSAKKHFDYIVIDTSPVEAVVDALYLARLSDVVLFVVKWASSPQTLARKAVNALADNVKDGTPIIAVLNQQERSKLFGGHNQYSGYYTN